MGAQAVPEGLPTTPSLPQAMELLNALPESVKGCLLEAARLCGSGVGAAQQRLLRASSAQVGPSTSV